MASIEDPNEPTVKELVESAIADITIEVLNNPEFEKSGLVHDWRNHVIEEIIDCWDQLSLETRAAVYLQAAWSAQREEWE